MSKVLKTGDVKRVPRESFGHFDAAHDWAVVDYLFRWAGVTASTRREARANHNYWGFGRIARVLSVGPKLVTVRIEK